jgi:hypothetical protein
LAEIEYYRSGNIKITSTRAIFWSKMYAINGLTSTDVIPIHPSSALPILLVCVGMAWSGCCFLGMPNIDRIFASINIVLGLAVVALAIFWMTRRKTTYAVVLCTAAGEIQAYFTYDRSKADKIVRAIDKAIIARG